MIRFPRIGDGSALAPFPGFLRLAVRQAGLFPETGTQSVAILGAGNGGLALAGYLAQQGQRVALWNRSAERVAPVVALGGIRLTLPGSSAVVANIPLATTDLAAAVSSARLVLVAVPASA